jgi:hypothetical protein
MSTTNLTNRDLNIIYDKVSKLVVDDICSAIVDGAPLTETLKTNLETQMIQILKKPTVQEKMGSIIEQNVSVTLRKATKGDLLLYAFLTMKSVEELTISTLLQIFKSVYESGDTNNAFVDRLIRMLYKPPYSEWFPSAFAGGARKTSRRGTKRGARMLPTASKTRKRSPRNKRTIGGANIIMDVVKGIGAKARNTGKGIRNTGKGVYDAVTGAPYSVKNAVVSGYNKIRGSNKATETEITARASGIYDKYSQKLVEMTMKQLNKTSQEVAKKMTNASYVYMMQKENSSAVLNSVLIMIENTIANTSYLKDIFPVLLVQALYNSRSLVGSTILDILGTNDMSPPDKNMVNRVIDALRIKLGKTVGDVQTE